MVKIPKQIREIRGNWNEYKGEKIWEGEDKELIEEKFKQMNEYDYDGVKSFIIKKIRTKDRDKFKKELNKRFEEANKKFRFVFNLPYPNIEKKGKIKTEVFVSFDKGRRCLLGGKEWKKQQVLLEVRKLDYWLYYSKVLKPVLEKYNERYPY